MSSPQETGNVSIKQRILDEAMRLFAERGYDGTSLQAVADAVGIRKPSVLYHFPTKEDLREVVLGQMLGRWREDMPRVLAAATSGGDRLNRALQAMMSFFVEKPDRARIIVREMLDRPVEMRQKLQEHLSPWTSLVTNYIRTGQESGRVHPDLKPGAYVLQIVTMAIGTVATGGVAASILDASEDTTVPTQLSELVRIARTSLFLPRPK